MAVLLISEILEFIGYRRYTDDYAV